MLRHPNILNRHKTALLIIDVQNKFAPVVPDFDQIEKNCITLIKACRIFNVPLFYTEQYPKGLGRTTDALLAELHELQPIEKRRFSAAGEDILLAALKEHDITHIILVGIEAHVCVLQSALDFSHMGYDVHVIHDATASRRSSDCNAALERMRQNGITISSLESCLFELTESSAIEQFKSISQFVK